MKSDIVARQGIKYSLVGFFGFLIGAFSAIFLYPFDFAFYGKLRYILSVAELVFPFLAFGFAFNTVRFYPQLKKDNNHQKFLFLSFGFVGLSTMLIGFIIFIFSNFFRKFDFYSYRWIILFLAFFLALTQILSKYISNLQRIAITNVFENVFPKLAVISGFIAFVFFHLSSKVSILIFICVFAFATISLLTYLIFLQPISFKHVTSFSFEKKFLKSVFHYGFFTLLGSIGSIIALRIDNIMIGEIDYLGEYWLGIYATLFSLVFFINIPATGIYSVSTPLINIWMINNEWEKVNELYKKSSFYLLLFGVLMLLLILSIKDALFMFMKNGDALKEQSHIIIIIGLGILFDQATGFNGQILSVSKYYRWNIVFVILLGFLTVFLNYVLSIQMKLGLTGIAISSATALFIYNCTRLWFNYKKFSVHPFSWNMLNVGFLLVICFSLNYIIVLNVQDILFRSILNISSVVLLLVIFNKKFNWLPYKYIHPKYLKKLLGL